MSQIKHSYPDVTPQPSFSQIEKRILQSWAEQKTFERSVAMRDAGAHGKNEFVFYDGPPFANGLPHYGHVLTAYVKDIVPRYQTMRGKRVERRFGWDCHGLPAEMESEKELKISGRQQIEEYGIAKFNKHCETSVLKYTSEWEQYVTRQARWVDFKNDYKTMDRSYMESVIWAFKQLWDKGLVYQGNRVMPYSWACETPLSNFEIRLDNAYRPRQDPAVTVSFALNAAAGETPLRLLVWTTTPWTLPSNLAIAVGPEIDYTIVEDAGNHYVLAEGVRAKYEKQLENGTVIGSIKGSELVGRTYTPLFPYFKDTPNAFRVLGAAFVSTEDGTGIVHMAPGFGEEDQKVCEAHAIPLVCPVDRRGQFTAEVPDFQGQLVFDANKNIIQALKQMGVLVKHETYVHNYPHCWRTDTPIIYRALNSWYVRVTEFKDRMVELNQQINWVPDHVKNGQFGRWLENARDWSISRNRFWGTPIPIWISDDPKYPRMDVYGSIDELERDFGVRPEDLHRPFIDDLVRANPDDPTGQSRMRRVEEVFDCWFESGSMPFAQVHYPFENKEWFEDHFPADFIVEYVAQTRGWFYTLMVLGTALFDRPPFKNCICHGVVLDEDGQKLSKRLRNYVSLDDVFEKYGADALRWFLCSSPVLRGAELVIDKDGRNFGEVIRTVINPIWNAYYFFTLYANSDGIKAQFDTSSPQRLDRYILAKTRELIEGVTATLDTYDIASACENVTAYIEALNNWYIRRSRERFWKSEIDDDKRQAYNTLYSCLVTLCKVCAPLLPLLTEEIYRGLTGEESIHLINWPESEALPKDPDLVREMDLVRDVCSTGLSIRETKNLRTRLPLQSITIAGKSAEALAPYADLIREELNVKELRTSADIDALASLRLEVNAKMLGPRLGGKVQEVIKSARAGEWKKESDGSVSVSGTRLEANEFRLSLIPQEGMSAKAISTSDMVVALDTVVTPALEEEGLARDLIRLVQQKRKEAGLHVSDHIALDLGISDQMQQVIDRHRGFISDQVLAKQITFGSNSSAHRFTESLPLFGGEIQIGFSKSA